MISWKLSWSLSRLHYWVSKVAPPWSCLVGWLGLLLKRHECRKSEEHLDTGPTLCW